jgi:hypothetical protein
MTASVNMRAFWDIVPCSFVVVDGVSEVYTASTIRMLEVVRTSETSVYSETTWRYILEGSHALRYCSSYTDYSLCFDSRIIKYRVRNHRGLSYDATLTFKRSLSENYWLSHRVEHKLYLTEGQMAAVRPWCVETAQHGLLRWIITRVRNSTLVCRVTTRNEMLVSVNKLW